MDHQRKVVRSMKTGKGEVNGQSFCVVGDGGIILSYVVVPDTRGDWTDEALQEVVDRHPVNHRPGYVYVDRDCCNGKGGGRTDKNMMICGLIKKLDCMHLELRISNEIPAEHPRKGALMKKVTRAIYVDCPEDVEDLRSIRERHPDKCANLTARQLKWDRTKHVRRRIPNGRKAA